MTEENKTSKRFTQTAAEIKITHIPQCNRCTRNIDGCSCEKFSFKPEKFIRNKEDCRFKITEIVK